MDVSGNRLFRELADGRGHSAHFSIPYPSHLDVTLKFMQRRTAETPLRFDAMYFRSPRITPDGGRSCTWIERCTITDPAGCLVVNDHYPARQQINIPYLRYRLNTRQLTPLMKVAFRPAFPDMPDSPVVTHVERLWDMLDYETALRDGMLTDDPAEAQPELYAIIEQTTGLVLPLAVGMRVEFILGGDDVMTIRAMPAARRSRYRSHNGHERYECADGYDENRLRDDIARWSHELGRHIDRRRTAEFADWRKAIEELKERTRDYDRNTR